MAEELKPIRHLRVHATDEQKREVEASGLRATGDVVLAWVNEGDLLTANMAPPAPPTDEQVEAAARAIAKLYQEVTGDAREWRHWIEEARAALEAAGRAQ